MKPLNSVITSAVATVAIGGWSLAAQAASFTIQKNFTGITLRDVERLTGFAVAPPDTNGAVGEDHFVELINGAFAVYDKETGQLAQPAISDIQFWRDIAQVDLQTEFISDPRILYDPEVDRWFAAQIDVPFFIGDDNAFNLLPNNLLFAVSETADPTQGWTGFAIDADSSDSFFADFPTLGVDSQGVYLATNNFFLFPDPDDTVTGVTIVSIPKADLLSQTPTIANRTSFENIDARQIGFTLQPVTDFRGRGETASFLATECQGLDCGEFSEQQYDRLYRTPLLNSNTPTPVLEQPIAIDVARYSRSPLMLQPDGTRNLDGGDTRFGSTVYRVEDRIWAVHSLSVNGRGGLRWYELDALTNEIVQLGTIADPDYDYSFPSIAVNEFKDVVIGFSRSGANEFVSSYAVVGETIDGKTRFSDPVLLKAGTSNYRLFGGEGERWGDYSATTVDPSDPRLFWTVQEWAAGTNQWATQITAIRVTRSVPESSLLPALFSMGALAMYSKWSARNVSKRKEENEG